MIGGIGMNDTEKLLPCPFCGGKAHVMKKECLSNGYITYGIYHSMFEHANCILSGQLIDAVFETEEKAMAAWNNRFKKSEEPT